MLGNLSVLVIDENIARREQLEVLLEFIGEPCKVIGISDTRDTLQRQRSWRAVIIGQTANTPVPSLIDAIHADAACVPILLLDEHPEIESSTPAVLGRLPQPFEYAQLTNLIHHCQDYLRKSPKGKPITARQEVLFRSLVGRSEGIQQVRQLIEQVAVTDANVLVLGESGTGKEVVARNIHYLSSRKDGPFIPVNCGAIPGELLESELFGHEKGAFTGAVSARKGRFELAAGGTLFLDEIGDMPLQMQVKLLRVLQERLFERVGGNSPIKADVRIIAATHRDLEKMIAANDFREDLYYRLNVFPIDMPALNKRQDDIPLLLQELVERLRKEHAAVVRFTEKAIDSLMLHPWSGNVRELSNLVERLVILYPNGLVDVNDLPIKYRHIDVPEFEPEYDEAMLEHEALMSIFQEEVELPPETNSNIPTQLPPGGVNLKEMLSELEIDMIRQGLDQTDWVVSRAAELLGMRRTTLVEKMRKYNLNRQDR